MRGNLYRPRFVNHRDMTSTTNSRAANVPLKIALIPGDGIGKEVIGAARVVMESLNLKLQFEHLDAGFETFQKTGNALPEKTLASLKTGGFNGALFGAVSSPSHKVEGYTSPIVKMRKLLDLYANIRPVSAAADVSPSKKAIDMVIVRENTECLYVKQEVEKMTPEGRRAEATRVITEKATRRIANMAFRIARGRAATFKRKARVTIVHKSNVLSITDGLFREVCRDEWEKNFKDVDIEEQLVDSMVYRLFREPHVFDVAVAPNLYGDIISDGAAALVGSLGLVPGANVGDDFFMAEPVHGSAPDIAGKGIANPIAAIRSASMLFEKFGLIEEAKRINDAVDNTLAQGVRTPDLGGKNTTKDTVDSIVKNLKR
jgi:homoisocitrate dehydrogenase